MSLTSQIKGKNSPVRRFFTKYENGEGLKECLTQLQSTKPIRQPLFTPASAVVYAFAGTTADYLIRYAANENSLSFEDSIAHQALEYAENVFRMSVRERRRLADLYETGKEYLDGRDAADSQAIYSATALAMLDNVFRSRGRLPELFDVLNARYRRKQVKELGLSGDFVARITRASRKMYIKTLRERRLQNENYEAKARLWLDKAQMEELGLEIPEGGKSRFLVDVYRAEKAVKVLFDKIQDMPTSSLFDAYFYTELGGSLYVKDVSELVKTFVSAIKSQDSELFNARMVVFNRELENSWMVGGADFDCVIEYDDRLILTDIKTTIKPLTAEHFRQILGYALLYDEKEDDFKFTDIGIYHSRSGSFRFLPIDHIIEKSLPSFKSVSLARQVFISEIKKI
jgi:hypothetical protein